MSKITKRAVDSLTTGILWDDDVAGFGVRARGHGKHYVLKLRVGNRQRWISIGRHGSPWTPDSARDEARRLLGLKATGKDPTTEREAAKNCVTVEDLAERFMDEHVAHRCKSSTSSD
jgi:Arm DNA-binding domain